MVIVVKFPNWKVVVKAEKLGNNLVVAVVNISDGVVVIKMINFSSAIIPEM